MLRLRRIIKIILRIRIRLLLLEL